jgi:hypothetical protein
LFHFVDNAYDSIQGIAPSSSLILYSDDYGLVTSSIDDMVYTNYYDTDIDDGAIILENQTTNLIAGREDFLTGWSWGGDSGSVTPGYADPFGGNNASRIVLNSGASTVKYWTTIGLVPLGNIYSVGIWIKNIHPTNEFDVGTNLESRTETILPRTGWQWVTFNKLVGVGATNLEIRFTTTFSTDDQDFIAFSPQIEQNKLATSFTLNSRPRGRLVYKDPTAMNLDLTQDWTMIAKIKRTGSLEEFEDIISVKENLSAITGSLRLGVNTDNSMSFGFGIESFASGAYTDDNSFHHYAFKYVSGSAIKFIYEDGNLIGSSSGDRIDPLVNTTEFQLGAGEELTVAFTESSFLTLSSSTMTQPHDSDYSIRWKAIFDDLPSTRSGVESSGSGKQFGLYVDGAGKVISSYYDFGVYGAELVANGEFVSNLTNWNPLVAFYTSASWQSSWNGRDGVMEFVKSGSEGSYGTITHGSSFDTKPGLTYRIRYDLYAPSSNTTMRSIRVRFSNPDWEYVAVIPNTVVDEWVHFDLLHTKVGLSSFGFRIYTADSAGNLGGGTNESVYLDNFSVVEISQSEQLYEVSSSAIIVADGVPHDIIVSTDRDDKTWFIVDGQTISSQSTFIPTGSLNELVTDGIFEFSNSFWSASGDTNFANNRVEYRYSGSEGYLTHETQSITILSGRDYYLSYVIPESDVSYSLFTDISSSFGEIPLSSSAGYFNKNVSAINARNLLRFRFSGSYIGTGSELVTDGAFTFSSSAWSASGDVNFANNQVEYRHSGSEGYLTQSLAVANNMKYYLEYDIIENNGSSSLFLTGSFDEIELSSSVGTHITKQSAINSDNLLRFRFSGSYESGSERVTDGIFQFTESYWHTSSVEVGDIFFAGDPVFVESLISESFISQSINIVSESYYRFQYRTVATTNMTATLTGSFEDFVLDTGVGRYTASVHAINNNNEFRIDFDGDGLIAITDISLNSLTGSNIFLDDVSLRVLTGSNISLDTVSMSIREVDIDTGQPLTIGRYTEPPKAYEKNTFGFNGEVHRVDFYNRFISQSEAEVMYNTNDNLSRDKWNDDADGPGIIIDPGFETSYWNNNELLGWLPAGTNPPTFISKSAYFSGSGFIYQRLVPLDTGSESGSDNYYRMTYDILLDEGATGNFETNGGCAFGEIQLPSNLGRNEVIAQAILGGSRQMRLEVNDGRLIVDNFSIKKIGSTTSLTKDSIGTTVWNDNSPNNNFATLTDVLVDGNITYRQTFAELYIVQAALTDDRIYAIGRLLDDNSLPPPLTEVQGATIISGDKIKTGVIKSYDENTLFNLNESYLQIKKPTYVSTTEGIWIGMDDDEAKLNIGDDSNYVKWTGADLEISGSVFGSLISGSEIIGGTITGGKIFGGSISGSSITGSVVSSSTIYGGIIATSKNPNTKRIVIDGANNDLKFYSNTTSSHYLLKIDDDLGSTDPGIKIQDPQDVLRRRSFIEPGTITLQHGNRSRNIDAQMVYLNTAYSWEGSSVSGWIYDDTEAINALRSMRIGVTGQANVVDQLNNSIAIGVKGKASRAFSSQAFGGYFECDEVGIRLARYAYEDSGSYTDFITDNSGSLTIQPYDYANYNPEVRISGSLIVSESIYIGNSGDGMKDYDQTWPLYVSGSISGSVTSRRLAMLRGRDNHAISMYDSGSGMLLVSTAQNGKISELANVQGIRVSNATSTAGSQVGYHMTTTSAFCGIIGRRIGSNRMAMSK